MLSNERLRQSQPLGDITIRSRHVYLQPKECLDLVHEFLSHNLQANQLHQLAVVRLVSRRLMGKTSVLDANPAFHYL